MRLKVISGSFLTLMIVGGLVCSLCCSCSDNCEYDPEPLLEISPVPKLGETAELNFYDSGELRPEKAWVEVTHRNTVGSYQEYITEEAVPVEEILVDGSLSVDHNPSGHDPKTL